MATPAGKIWLALCTFLFVCLALKAKEVQGTDDGGGCPGDEEMVDAPEVGAASGSGAPTASQVCWDLGFLWNEL